MTGKPYTKSYMIRWCDLDPNRHLRNTAYGDYTTDLRFSYLESAGFPFARFAELQIGTVAFNEQSRYLREVNLWETITMALEMAALAPDGTRWRMRHTMHKEDGVVAAVIEMEGAWMDIKLRKLTVPPAELRDALLHLARSEDFEELASGKKSS